MRHTLLNKCAERMAMGLQRKAITTGSRWAEKYRMMGKPLPGPFTFKYHPWMREMHDCTSELMIGQKSAQAGFTECAINKMFFAADVEGESCMYILPTEENSQKFSASRFDPALELSPHLRGMFTDTKNVGHKRAGSANIFFRGSMSANKLISDPIARMMFDEVDRMCQANIPLAMERMSGQLQSQAFMLSTPTIPKKGINKYYLKSTMEHFFFTCPHCGRSTELIYPDCLEATAEDTLDNNIYNSHLKCKECNHKLDHETKTDWLANGKWVAQHPERMTRGFYINQLYSATMQPWKIVNQAIKAITDPAEEQELWNSKLGTCFVVEGAKVTDEMIENCIGNYQTQDIASSNTINTMGVDVGKWLHVEIDQWTMDASSSDPSLASKCKVLKATKVKEFEELDTLMRQYQILSCVIDANPERRKAREFAERFTGAVRMCFYGSGNTGKQLKQSVEEELSVTVDRTSWLDVSLGRFKGEGRITLPMDISYEYKEHIKEPVRVYEKDRSGNPVGRYLNDNDDHFAHTRNYAEIALPIGVALTKNQDIRNIY